MRTTTKSDIATILSDDTFRSSQRQKGFSLLELMLVLCIIGLLFTVILPRLQSGSNNAKLNLARQHATEIGLSVVRWVTNQNIQAGTDGNRPFSNHLMDKDTPLVGHYTGSHLFSGVEKIMHSTFYSFN